MYEKIYSKIDTQDVFLDVTDSLEVNTLVSSDVVSGSGIAIHAELVKTNEYLLLIIAILLITFAWRQIVTNMQF